MVEEEKAESKPLSLEERIAILEKKIGVKCVIKPKETTPTAKATKELLLAPEAVEATEEADESTE